MFNFYNIFIINDGVYKDLIFSLERNLPYGRSKKVINL